MDKKIELVATGGIDNFRSVDCSSLSPGRNEIRIRQHAAGVNYIDIYQRTGLYPLPLPAVLGVEGAGVVEAVGPEVSHLRAGDRIAYAGIPGGYAAIRLLPAWRAIKLPSEMDLELAAASFLRGFTAHMLLTRTCRAGNGTVILVHAAAGGLGTTLVRWAKSLGCVVIGTVGSPAKADIASANGADHVIIGRDADVVTEVGRVTGGEGVDFVIDGIGGNMLRQSLGSVRKFGVVASIGQAAGPIPPISVDDLGPIRSLSLARPSVMAYAAEQETYRLASSAVVAAIQQGIIRGAGHTYPLEKAGRAHQDLESGVTSGSLILIP